MPTITIIGAGLAGLSLAHALKSTDCRITLLDAAQPRKINLTDPNARSIALSYSSTKIFSAMQIWDKLLPYTTPIKIIHISDRGHFGMTRIKASDLNIDALGHSIQAQAIGKVLQDDLANADNIKLLQEIVITNIDHEHAAVEYTSHNEHKKLTADLIILAEGGQSNLSALLNITREEKDYQQTAIVGNVSLSRPHDNIAYERFTENGPIALLPQSSSTMALVWTTKPEIAKELLTLSDEQFLQALQKNFGFRTGHFLNTTKLSAYPLKLMLSDKQVLGKVLILGNAAHTLHPVAAQGFNLSLRDIHWLAKRLKSSLQQTPGKAAESPNITEALREYQKHRQSDQRSTTQFTDNLINIFSHNFFPITPLRGFGLTLLDNISPLKNYLAKRAMGLK